MVPAWLSDFGVGYIPQPRIVSYLPFLSSRNGVLVDSERGPRLEALVDYRPDSRWDPTVARRPQHPGSGSGRSLRHLRPRQARI